MSCTQVKENEDVFVPFQNAFPENERVKTPNITF